MSLLTSILKNQVVGTDHALQEANYEDNVVYKLCLPKEKKKKRKERNGGSQQTRLWTINQERILCTAKLCSI